MRDLQHELDQQKQQLEKERLRDAESRRNNEGKEETPRKAELKQRQERRDFEGEQNRNNDLISDFF